MGALDMVEKTGEAKSYFLEQRAFFIDELAKGARLSKSVDRRFVPLRVGWAQWIHLKLCILGNSLARVANFETQYHPDEEYTLDQSAIAGIARAMIEAAAMIAYLPDEPENEEQWQLRRLVICLNDAATRYRMFKGMKSADQRADFGDAMRDLRSELKANSQFKNLAADRREKILSGQEVYVFGLRDAVRLMGWDVDEFNFIYAYLSSHSHSGPVSFMRLDEHGVDFLNPTSAQYSTAALAIEFAIKALQVGSARIASLFPSAG